MGLLINNDGSMPDGGVLADPNAQAYLGLMSGLLNAGGPSRMPVSTGQAIGQGIQAANQGAMTGYQLNQQALNYKMAKQKMAMLQALIDESNGGGHPQPQQQAPSPYSSSSGMTGGAVNAALDGQGATGQAMPVVPYQSQHQSYQYPSGNGMFGDPQVNQLRNHLMLTGALGIQDQGTQDVLQTALKAYEPTDFAKTLRSAGIQDGTPLFNQLMQDNIRKQNNIPPTRLGESAYFDPQTGQVVSMAPYVAASTRAKEENQIIPVKMGSGATNYMFAGQAAGAGGPYSQTNPVPKQNSKDPWSSIPQMTTPSGIGQTTYGAKREEAAAQLSSSLYETLGQNARDADDRMAYNNQALALVDKADTGTLSNIITDAKTALVSAGVPEDDFKNTPAANIALNKDLTNAALQRGRKLFGARFTQSEVGIMLNKAAPSANQTKTALKFLLHSDNAQLQYQKDMAEDYAKYDSMGGDPRQFNSWYAKNFPLSSKVEDVKFGVNQNQGMQDIPFTVDSIEAELAKRGIK